MKEYITGCVLFIMLTVFAGCEKDDCGGIVPGEVMVDFVDSISTDSVEIVIDNYGLEVNQNLGHTLNIYLINVPDGEEEYWAEELMKESIVEAAQLNHYVCLN